MSSAPIRRLRPLAAALVAASVVFTGTIPTQAQVSQAAVQNAPHALLINILEGEGALNNIRQRDAREPVIQVTDENHKPVAGVAIVFLIHGGQNGAGATFPGGVQSLTVTTGADGTAHASGLQVANAPGSFTISVTATLSGLVATAIIHQANIIGALTTTTTSGSTAGSTTGSTSSSTAGSTSSSAGGSAGGSAGSTAGTVARHGILHASKGILIGTTVVAATVAGIVVATKSNNATSLTLGGTHIGP